MRRRFDIKAILKDPEKRRWMMTRAIMAIQQREGINTTLEQAEAAYDAERTERTERSDAYSDAHRVSLERRIKTFQDRREAS